MKKEISSTQYQEGLFNISHYLLADLVLFLKDEGRYKFRMLGYIDSIQLEFKKAHLQMTAEDLNVYGRVLYNLRKAIPKDYKRLRVRNLSPADSIICVVKKLYDVSESLAGENRFKEEQNKIKEFIQKFYDNMRNKVKYDHLKIIEKTILESCENKKWGTLCLKELDLYRLEHPEEKPQELSEEKTTWDLSGSRKEVNL